MKTAVKISSLAYLIMPVKDAQASMPFYRDTLGLKVSNDDGVWVEFQTGGCTLALHSDSSLAPATVHGALPVFNVDDFNGTIELLKSAGVKIQNGPKEVCEVDAEQVGMSFEIQDPDGNFLSIYGTVAK